MGEREWRICRLVLMGKLKYM